MNNLPKRRRNPKRVCNRKTNVGQIFALSVGSFSLFHRADCVQSRRVYGNNSIHDYIVSQQTAKIESCHAHTKFRVFISFARDDDDSDDVDEKLAFD